MITKQQVYVVSCDMCAQSLTDNVGLPEMFIVKDQAIEEVQSDDRWNMTHDNKMYCPKCHTTKYNDNDELCAYGKDGKLLGTIINE